ncbi:MAG: hypothetical protein R6T91_05900 [Bacteroidales bacterium]
MTAYKALTIGLILALAITLNSCKSTNKKQADPVYDEFVTNPNATGDWLEVKLTAGPAYNHPVIAIWLEDTNRQFIQTLYVSQTIAKGVFERGKVEQGQWMPGEIQRPSAIPVWSHQHIDEKNEFGNFLPTPEDPVVDALTGPTPLRSFILKAKTNQPITSATVLMLEINQAFDFNEHWVNAKYPDKNEYMKSGQPSIVYRALINPNQERKEFELKPYGHGHYAGENGEVNNDLSTLTTAKKIIGSAMVRIE